MLKAPSLESPNEKVRQLVMESVRASYLDVLQREPSADETHKSMSVELLTLNGMLDFLQRLLCTPEFLSRFALAMTPLLLARVLINQIEGRAPTSQDEINEIAGKVFELGWLGSVTHLLGRTTVRRRILTEIRNRAHQLSRLPTETSRPIDRSQGAPDNRSDALGVDESQLRVSAGAKRRKATHPAAAGERQPTPSCGNQVKAVPPQARLVLEEALIVRKAGPYRGPVKPSPSKEAGKRTRPLRRPQVK